MYPNDISKTTNKHSIGALRKNRKTKPRSPDLTGTLKFQRHTFEHIAKAFSETDEDEATCNLAGWANHDRNGEQYLTVEISPLYVRKEPQVSESHPLDWFMNGDVEETHH
jgi:hypothetical protein